MNSGTVVVIEVVRALQETWTVDEQPQPISEKPLAYKKAINRKPAYQRLVHQIGTVRSQIPNRREVVDGFGRRLITWGWHLRMRYGSSNR